MGVKSWKSSGAEHRAVVVEARSVDTDSREDKPVEHLVCAACFRTEVRTEDIPRKVPGEKK